MSQKSLRIDHYISLLKSYELRVHCVASVLLVSGDCLQIQRTDGQWYWAEYSTFSISDEVGKYQLTVDGYSGDAGDAMAGHATPNENSNGMMFTTLDRDNDYRSGGNCAVNLGGWWYHRCSGSLINIDTDGGWVTESWTADVQASRMLVKLN